MLVGYILSGVCLRCSYSLGYLPYFLRNIYIYIYNTSYYHHQIGCINLFHCCHMFPGCVPQVVVPLYVVGFTHIYIYIYMYVYNLGTTGSCFFLLLCNLMMCANNQVHYGLVIVLICLNITLIHYHHYADVSQGFEILTCLPGTFFLSVCLRLSQLSIIFHAIFGAVCIQLTYLSYDDCVFVLYLIIIIKSEVWPICHCLGYGMAWFGMVWFGMVWRGTVRYGTVSYDTRSYIVLYCIVSYLIISYHIIVVRLSKSLTTLTLGSSKIN